MNPSDFGIPHEKWRPNQYEMFQKCSNTLKRGGGTVIAELGTGSGKSAVATGLSHFDQVTVLVHTLGLSDQYVRNYGFETIKGRQEYPCAHTKKVVEWQYKYKLMPTALDCHYPEMDKCEYSHNCQYLIQKRIALQAQRLVCTYRYASLSWKVQERPGILVMDEAHDSVEELIADHEFVVRQKYLDDFKLPPFPIKASGANGKGDLLGGDQLDAVKKWLTACIEKIGSFSEEELETPFGARAMRLLNRMSRLLVSLVTQPFFISTIEKEPAIKALQAKDPYRNITRYKRTVVLMSATIGNPEPLAEELGIHQYQSYTFPHPIPPPARPVHVLPAPTMTHYELTEHPENFAKQAVVIARWARQFPEEWRGIVLTTSYYKVDQIAKFLPLHLKGKHRFIAQTTEDHLSSMIDDFTAGDVRDGDILIGTIQGWGSGLDLYGDLARWVVVAGVPHQNPTDIYAKARRQLSGGQRYQLWYTYNKIPQACGRVSRGEKDENGRWIVSYAALGDRSAVTGRAKSFYPDWFKEAFR